MAFKSLLQTSFVSQLGSACRAFTALCQLTVDEILGDSAIVHAYHMPQPAHASLLQQCVHAGDSSSLQDAVVCDFVLPGDVQDAAEAVHVECTTHRLCYMSIILVSLSA